jgi:hypothetical protein
MMRNWIIFLILFGVVGSAWTQEDAVQVEARTKMHQSLLAVTSYASLSSAEFFLRTVDDRDYSVVHRYPEASVYVPHNERHYLLYAHEEAAEQNLTIYLELFVFPEGNLEEFIHTAFTIHKSPQAFHLRMDPKSASGNGYQASCFAPLASRYMDDCICESLWWEGLLAFDPAYLESRSYYASRDEAVSHVPYHVQPKSCFVWRDGPASLPWRPIPGTGCAHWVAHQKGITASIGCYDRYAIRVSQVVEGKGRYSISQARVGDIWTTTSLSHCGIVIGVGNGSVRVRHCSSGSGGVVENDFYSGYIYR